MFSGFARIIRDAFEQHRGAFADNDPKYTVYFDIHKTVHQTHLSFFSLHSQAILRLVKENFTKKQEGCNGNA